jgi:glycosyltransferase involved in cell wall biosynthesis
MTHPPRRIVVVSHPNVVPHNQRVYVRLGERGWDVKLIVPNRWADDYTPDGFTPQPDECFTGTFARVRVARPGAIQRHFYVTRPSSWLERWRPDTVFLEQEPFSIPALQWGVACQRLGIPWGLQGDENLDRPFPWPARAIRHWVTPQVDYFAARSPTAGQMLKRWGARGRIEIVPHTIPEWPLPPPRPDDARPFTIGFAGRLVPAKGIADLIAAAARLNFPFRLLVAGDGPLRAWVESAHIGGGRLELRPGLRSAQMPDVYAEMDLLVLPSRTTPTWAEQFGKVLCEALLCGVPVLGSSSGEIPWVIETSGGGRVFPEGDVETLARMISEWRGDDEARREFARRGRAGVERHFVPAVAARALDELIRSVLDGDRHSPAATAPRAAHLPRR